MNEGVILDTAGGKTAKTLSAYKECPLYGSSLHEHCSPPAMFSVHFQSASVEGDTEPIEFVLGESPSAGQTIPGLRCVVCYTDGVVG